MMRKSYAAQISRTQKKDVIKVNESKKTPSKQWVEKANEEPTVEFVPGTSLTSSNSDGEEPEEDPEEQLEEDSELDPEEDIKEDPEEQLEENSESDPEEDPEDILEEESGEEYEEEYTVECVTQSLSCHNNNENQQVIENPDEDEDPSEEYVSEASSEDNTHEADNNSSNVKKRSVDATTYESAQLKVCQSQKKCRYEEAFNPELDVVKNPTFQTTPKPEPLKFSEKLYIPAKGHKSYACPRWQSTLKTSSCDKCGSLFHPTSSCLLITIPQVINHSSRLDFVSIPNTKKGSCDTCGSLFHPTFSCLLTRSPQLNNPLYNSSRPTSVSIPNTKNKPIKETSDANLYVGYLSHAVDDDQLRELFSPFGKITEAEVIKNRTTGLSEGYGFVKFENPIEADLAVMHMNGYQMDGKTLAVRVAARPPPSASSSSSSSSLSNLLIYPGPPAVPPGVPYPAAWVGVPQTQVSFPNFGVTTTTNTFPVVSSLGGPKSASSSTGLLAHFPGDPDYPGLEFKQYFAPATSGPFPPFYFAQMP